MSGSTGMVPSVHTLADVYRWFPVVFVVWAASVVVFAFRGEPESFSRSEIWWMLLPWLFLAADSVRPGSQSTLEHTCKGAAAVLLMVALVVAGWRRYRWRRANALAVDEPAP